MATSYAIATVIESSIYCAQDDDVLDHSTAAKAVNITMASIIMIINPIIVGIVLRQLKSRINSPGTIRTMFIKIALLGSLFELACSLRIVLVLKQYDWKINAPWKYNIVFIGYILLGEVAC